jgi:exosome complex component RRP4
LDRVIGNNGNIWISPTINVEVEGQGGFTQNLEAVSKGDRETIVRIKNCILALSTCFVLIYDTSIMLIFEESLKYEVKDLLNEDDEDIIYEIGYNTKQRLLLHE